MLAASALAPHAGADQFGNIKRFEATRRIAKPFAVPDYPEALQLFLGNDGGGFIEVGFFLNSDASEGLGGLQGPRVIESGSGVASMAAESYPGTEGGFFRIFDIIGSFNTIKFVDASGLSLLGVGQDPLGLGTPPSRADGFDIGELSVTSVPEPGTLLLLGAGLAGLGFVGRRRNAA